MLENIEVTLVPVRPSDFPGGGAMLPTLPRVGDFIDHGVDGESRLFRVVAVAMPANVVSDLQTFDIYFVDEGPYRSALDRLLDARLGGASVLAC